MTAIRTEAKTRSRRCKHPRLLSSGHNGVSGIRRSHPSVSVFGGRHPNLIAHQRVPVVKQ